MLSVQEGAQKALRQVARFEKGYGRCFKLDDKQLKNMITSADNAGNGYVWIPGCCRSINCGAFNSCSECWGDLMEKNEDDD